MPPPPLIFDAAHLGPWLDGLAEQGLLLNAKIHVPPQTTDTTTATTSGKTDTDESSQFKSASKPSLGFMVWPWLVGAAVAAIALFAVWRLKPNWIGWVLKLLGR